MNKKILPEGVLLLGKFFLRILLILQTSIFWCDNYQSIFGLKVVDSRLTPSGSPATACKASHLRPVSVVA